MNRHSHHPWGWWGMARILSLLPGTTIARPTRFPIVAFQQWDKPTLPLHSQRQIQLFLTTPMGNFMAEPENSQFGRQDYWNQFYEETSQFSWYAGWKDLEPFVQEFVHVDDSILIPGVGNDAMLVDMYQAGFTHLTAMDYAAQGIARCREMLQESQRQQQQESSSSQSNTNTNANIIDEGVTLVVADARDLGHVFEDHSFQVIFEKGTLDAIFLSGGQNKTLAQENMNLAIAELGRCLKPGGIWISIAAVVDTQIQKAFDELGPKWECLVRREELFVTKDGYTSNNIDGSLLVWRKR